MVAFAQFGMSVGGLFSPPFENAPWSFAKVVDLLQHLWIPVIVLGLGGTASLIRVMRANLLDELHKPYVTTARLKGQKEFTLLMRYPVRAALNPFVSTLGWTLPQLVSGSTIVAVVLSLPMVGPMMLQALVSQEMYLAGSFILILSVLTVIGTLISDILLADPRHLNQGRSPCAARTIAAPVRVTSGVCLAYLRLRPALDPLPRAADAPVFAFLRRLHLVKHVPCPFHIGWWQRAITPAPVVEELLPPGTERMLHGRLGSRAS